MIFTVHPITTLHANWYTVYNAPATQDSIQWCTEQSSEGEFYFSLQYWWFELESDAIMFTLRWGNG